MPSLINPKADLKKTYHRTFEISLILSISVLIAAFKFSPKSSGKEQLKNEIPELITVEDILNTVQKPNIPPPPKAPQIISASIDDVPEDILVEGIEDYNPIPLPDIPPARSKVIDDEIIFVFVEEMPSPIGGIKSIQEKVHYTEIAKRIGLEGTVYVKATISKKGNVEDATILKGLGGGLDEESLNAVLATKFNPGKQRGKPVNVKMVIPIKFVLK